TRQLLAVLANSPSAVQRQKAADELANSTANRDADVIQALITAARRDPMPSGRSACGRCLVRIRGNTLPGMNALVELKNDTDAAVRTEAEQALFQLASCTPGSRATSATQPIIATTPRGN